MSTASVAARPAGTLRASDEERAETIRRVHEALGEGRLDHTEAEERSAAATAATYREELSPLLADLPPASGPGPLAGDGVPSWTSIREALVWRAHLLVWGPGSGRPTAAHCRTASLVAVGAVVAFLLCAVLGALVVGA